LFQIKKNDDGSILLSVSTDWFQNSRAFSPLLFGLWLIELLSIHQTIPPLSEQSGAVLASPNLNFKFDPSSRNSKDWLIPVPNNKSTVSLPH
jgi:hypothetical protein